MAFPLSRTSVGAESVPPNSSAATHRLIPILLELGIVAGLIAVLATPASPADRAGRGLTTEAVTRNLTCDDDLEAGTGTDPTGTLTIGPVGLIGIVTSKPLTLERLSDGVLWFKTYIVIPKSKEHRVDLSVRSLNGGKIGLDWGTQQSDNAKHFHYTPVGGHEILPRGGHETARWWPTKLPSGGQVICPR
jgi:hypothetical protein